MDLVEFHNWCNMRAWCESIEGLKYCCIWKIFWNIMTWNYRNKMAAIFSMKYMKNCCSVFQPSWYSSSRVLSISLIMTPLPSIMALIWRVTSCQYLALLLLTVSWENLSEKYKCYSLPHFRFFLAPRSRIISTLSLRIYTDFLIYCKLNHV